MFFDAWVHGELDLPPGYFTTWLSLPLTSNSSLPEFVVDDAGCDDREPLVLLERLHQLRLSPYEFLGVGADTGRIAVRGLLSDTSLQSAQGVLTALFGSAVGHGGDGRLLVVGRLGAEFGYEVQVCCGALTARTLTPAERDAFLVSRACAELVSREQDNLKASLLKIERAGAEVELADDELPPRPTAPSSRSVSAAG